MAALAGILESLYLSPAPDIETSSPGEILPLLAVGQKLRRLGRVDMVEFFRVLPMAIQELVDDTFKNEPLKAAIAAAGIQDLRQGPRSGGTAFVMLHHLVGAAKGSIRGRPAWRQGPNALANAIEDAMILARCLQAAAAPEQAFALYQRTRAPRARAATEEAAKRGDRYLGEPTAESLKGNEPGPEYAYDAVNMPLGV